MGVKDWKGSGASSGLLSLFPASAAIDGQGLGA